MCRQMAAAAEQLSEAGARGGDAGLRLRPRQEEDLQGPRGL